MGRRQIAAAWFVLAGVGGGLGACDSPGSGGAHPYDGGSTGVDLAADGAGEADSPVVTDTGADTVTDAVEDSATDAMTDTPPDAVEDSATDAIEDSATDAVEDSATDAVEDSATDAVEDSATDAIEDSATDAATDTSDTSADGVTDTDACTPDCAGLACGDDGCGGSCGTCTGGATCVAGACKLPALPGDTCEAPLPLSGGLPIQVSGDTTPLSDDFSAPSGACPGVGAVGTGDRDAVYAFTAPDAGDYEFTLHGAFDTALYVASTCEDPAATCLGGRDDICSDCDEVVTLTLAQGEEVFVFVDGWGGLDEAGSYTLTVDQVIPCVPECTNKECGDDGCGGSCGSCSSGAACLGGLCESQAGDDCGGALSLSGQLPITQTGDTKGLNDTFSVAGGACAGLASAAGAGAPDRVYVFQAPTAGAYDITLSGAFDTALYVATTCDDPAGTCVGGDDQICTGCDETVSVSLASGQEVFIYVDGWGSGASGAFTISVAAGAPCVPDCAGAVCGDDGCGGSCGACPAGEVCDQGACVTGTGLTCAQAIPVDAVPYSDVNTTPDFGGPDVFVAAGDCPGIDHATGQDGTNRFYAFTAPKAGAYRFVVSSDDMSPALYVSSGCDVAGTCLAGSDAETFCASGCTESVALNLASGQTVYAVVDGETVWQDGVYTFAVQETCIPSCAGKECGGDGCGGSCGSCVGTEQCLGGQCVLPDPAEACANADPVGALPWTTTDWLGSTPAVSFSAGDCPGWTGGGGGGDEHIYALTAPQTGRYWVDLTMPTDLNVDLYLIRDCLDVPGTCLGASAWGFSGNSEHVVVDLTVGEQIFIVVDAHTLNIADWGAYTLSISACTPDCAGVACGLDTTCGTSCGSCAPPASTCGTTGQCDGGGVGESCAEPFVVDALPYTASSTTEGASNDAELNYCGDPTGPSTAWGQGTEDHVYRFTPTEDGSYRAALTVGKGFTGALYVTTSCADASAGCLAADRQLCADDYPNCVDEVTVPLHAGADYFFVVDGWAGQAGPYTFALDQTCTSQCGAKVCGPDPCMGSCGTCPGGAPCQPDGTCGPVAKLVINEVDYDQPGTDTAEFVEVFNAGGADADLTGVTLEVVNGTGGGVLHTFSLTTAAGTLAPGAYLVVGSASVVAALPGGTPALTMSDGSLQNGGADGDAVRLKGADGATLDAMSYEAPVAGAVEGAADAGADTGAGSLGRCPNGTDTDDNAADFTVSPTPTPGAANACP